MKHHVDASIIGTGFSGSILARVLAQAGMRVALVDSAKHPRFAIGESSTPIADLLLRRIGQTYKIPEFESLSTWGTWQQHHPELACGRKRGFSYYRHAAQTPFRETNPGDQSLLVAASVNDELADTHWYRQDVDEFLFKQAIETGVVDLTGHKVVHHEVSSDSSYAIECTGTPSVRIESDWLIDASGQAGILGRLTGSPDLTHLLQTRTQSIYAHYLNVGSWTEHLTHEGFDTTIDPFNGDDAAQHHLLESGWLWMLRFNNGVTSVGLTTSNSSQTTANTLDCSRYPSLAAMLEKAELVAPMAGPRASGRLQRFIDPVVDDRRLMLPTASVTIDPLHSTGIAHAMAGVERVARIILGPTGKGRAEMVRQYRQSILEETQMLDRLVSTAYESMNDFPRFTVACMLYFAGAIRCEERYQQGEPPSHLWNADDPQFVSFVNWACDRLVDKRCATYSEQIRERLQPWNTAGLMNASVANRYAYTATKKPL